MEDDVASGTGASFEITEDVLVEALPLIAGMDTHAYSRCNETVAVML